MLSRPPNTDDSLNSFYLYEPNPGQGMTIYVLDTGVDGSSSVSQLQSIWFEISPMMKCLRLFGNGKAALAIRPGLVAVCFL